MLLTLITEQKLYTVMLPGKIRGQYWLEDKTKEVTDKKRKLLGIEAENGVWKIKDSRRYAFYEMDGSKPQGGLKLQEDRMYIVEFMGAEAGQKGYLFTEADTKDRCSFRKYQFSPDTQISIGRGGDNEIVMDNKFVSPIHARLSLSGDVWTVIDNHSQNGVYINEQRLMQSIVGRSGDVIYIMGLKIVLGYRFLAVNNPDGKVSVREDILKPYEPVPIREYEEPEELEEKIYYRSPRFNPEIKPLQLKIDAPTNPQTGDDTPIILTLAPAMIMGVASFSTGIVTFLNVRNNGGSILSSLPTMLMSVSMLLGMVLFPFLMKRRDKKRKAEKEKERREKYLKYLDNIRAELFKASTMQKEILLENYPMVSEQYRSGDFFDMQLWSRAIGQKNFLTFRIGIGNVPLKADLKFPEERFSIDDDIMREEVLRFSKEKKFLENVPVTYSLLKHRISGIVGDGQAVNGILHNIFMQIAALYSYDEVKMIFICDERDFPKYDYVRFMQHIWDNDFRMRFLATTPEEVRNLSVYFNRIVEDYRGKENTCPHYLVISTSKALSDNCAFLSEILKDDTVYGFHYLAVYDELKNLPKECSAIMQLNQSQGTFFDYTAEEGEQIVFVPDRIKREEAEKAVMEIAGYRLDLQQGKYALPGMLTFLEMYHVGKYEHLNIAGRWKENNPVLSLKAPVGVNTDGELFYLDLHETEHGPHGLIAGMTGSGKSEFIITYVLSLAVNYSPEDIAFILIDYKGGGLVGAFDNEKYRLPHLAGTITNLDGAAINRSLLSIQSELRRRQAVFNEARNVSNEGTMDIYKYQKLYRSGIVKEPMPHLLIISDEFAELKSQQPEFMTQLISTARIGRSLGVHLILATQKPSGVVNDQIWANSKFKICLRVQDRADSMDMLKRPDAAELVETGRFYLQVGYNELFELGQSAWCGAPYLPTDTAENETDSRVQMIDHQGKVTEEVRLKKKAKNTEEARKQIVEIAGYIARIAEEEKLYARPLWLPEIPPIITIDKLEEKYGYQADESLNPIIGELDDPFNQAQRILTLPLSEKGNAVCYGAAGSGKENFLITVLYSLYMHHSGKELHVYILDFGAETLQMFLDAPQTGDFIVSGEEEKTKNLFRYLDRQIAERKKLFAGAGGDYAAYRRSGKTDVPYILIVINDYVGFSEQYEELNDKMPSLTRDCTKYGIFFLVTCTSTMGIRYRLQQNFGQFFALQLNDKSDYTSILGNPHGVYPSAVFGRGIYREKEVYEFQTASIAEDRENIPDTAKRFCRLLSEREEGESAKPIAVMPKAVYADDFGGEEISFAHIPIGIRCSTLNTLAVSPEKRSVLQVLAMDRLDTVPFAEGLCSVLEKAKDCEIYVLDPGRQLMMGTPETGEISQLPEEGRIHYIREQAEETVVKLFGMTVERHNEYKLSNGNPSATVDMHPVVVLLMGLAQIKKLLSADGVDKLRLILEKTSGRFNLFFFVLDNYASANTYNTEEWCKGEGLWIGNGIADQIRFRINARSRELTKPITYTGGWFVRQGKAEAVKPVVSKQEEKEEEDG